MADYRYIDRRQKPVRRPLVGTFSPLPLPNANSSLQSSQYIGALSLLPATGLKVTELAEVTHILACHCEGCTPRSNLFPELSSPTHSFVIPVTCGERSRTKAGIFSPFANARRTVPRPARHGAQPLFQHQKGASYAYMSPLRCKC